MVSNIYTILQHLTAIDISAEYFWTQEGPESTRDII
jgi:hypothetical protein